MARARTVPTAAAASATSSSRSARRAPPPPRGRGRHPLASAAAGGGVLDAAPTAAAVGSSTVNATPFRVADITIEDTTFETIAETDQVAVLFKTLDWCVVPAEQRAHNGSGDIPAALVKIEVRFPWDKPENASLLSPLTTDYPALVSLLRELTIAYNYYDENAALGAFAALAKDLQVLTFCECGLTSLRGLEGRCEYLRKVDLRGCKLTSIDALAERVYLEEVNVTHTGITSIDPLRSCPSLTKVFLNCCRQLPTDASLPASVNVIR